MAAPSPTTTPAKVRVIPLVTRAVREFLAEKPLVLAAALSYYTLLSLAPLVLVNQLKRFADGGQHAQCQTIHFQDAQLL